jgi:hypothetical protein
MIRPELETWIPKNWPPDWECSAKSLVAMSKARDVYALLIEISMLPIQAPSIRTCAMRFPPSSTTAMFMGCPISDAFFSAAPIILRASLRVIIWSIVRHVAPQLCRRHVPPAASEPEYRFAPLHRVLPDLPLQRYRRSGARRCRPKSCFASAARTDPAPAQ